MCSVACGLGHSAFIVDRSKAPEKFKEVLCLLIHPTCLFPPILTVIRSSRNGNIKTCLHSCSYQTCYCCWSMNKWETVSVVHTASFIAPVQVVPFCSFLLPGSSVIIGKSFFDFKERFGSHNHKYGVFLILMRLYIFIPCSLKFLKQKSLFQVSPLSFDLMIVFWGSFGAVWKLVCKVLAW
jgi:hypothetical protein